MSKKVLIVAYYWPPSGGGGVQRWVKFVKYLPGFDIEPIVFTPENPTFSFKDDTLKQDVDPATTVVKLPIWEPYSLLGFLKKKGTERQGQALDKGKKSWLDHLIIWIRGNFFIPDPRVFWVKPASKFLVEYIQKNKVDVIVTTGPPNSMHLIGKRVKQKTNVKWIADFRDPWSEWSQYKHLKVGKLALSIHRSMEKSVFSLSDVVIATNPVAQEDFRRLGAKHVVSITNGVDPSDFPVLQDKRKESVFLLSHIGTIDDLRDPRPFLEAFKALCNENENFAALARFRMTGIISGSYLEDYWNDPVLKGRLIVEDYVPHHEILQRVEDSDVLLLLLSDFDNALGCMPGKFFEYLYFSRPILALVPDGHQIQKDIAELQMGLSTNNVEVDKIKSALLQLFEQRKDENHTPSDAMEYTRQKLTSKLAEVIHALD